MIKTTSGNINSVAVVIDRLRLQELTDTISGDNTILSIFDTDENRKRIHQYI